MEAIFLKLVNMSITASYLILAVMVFRLVLKKAPKSIHCVLWGLVALRLVCPFSFESVLSLVPSAEPLPEEFLYAATPQIHTGIPYLNNALNPVIAESLTPIEPASANPTQIWSFIFSRVWIIGMAVMLLYAAVSYLRLRRKVRVSISVGKNVRLCDHICSPFILGILRPRIYLPSEISQETANHVLAHELAHIARKDHWWKPLGYLLLTVYWFNPFVWAAYVLLCRDIELACDERVVKRLDLEEKKAYSAALLRCSVSRRVIAACPLAFGEVGVKSRIRSVLNYKKPAFWIILVAVIASIAVGVCFLTDPADEDPGAKQQETLSAIIKEEGYTILKETEISLDITVPKAALPESILTEAEHEFEEKEIILYQTVNGTLYLQGTYQDPNDTEEPYLVFEFNFSYELQDSGTILTPYRRTEDGYIVEIALGSKDVRDPYTSYTGAAYLRGTGPSCQFDIAIKRSVWEAASESVTFEIDNFCEITYAKEGSELPVQQDRLVPGTYVPVECVYMNPASSYAPINLSEHYTYTVTEEGFHTDSFAFICNADAASVDWGWKTTAEAAEELQFLTDWMQSDWASIGSPQLSVSSDTLYQKINANTHLLMEGGNVYILHGAKARNDIETVWGIYRLVPESEVPDTDGQNVIQGEDIVTNIDLSDFLTEGNAITTTLDLSDGSFESNGAHLYMNLTSGAIYDSRSTLDKAIKEAILENHGGSNSENTLYAESHTILSQLVACGAYTGEGVGPCGYTTVCAITHVEEITAAPEIRTMSEWSYPVVLSFDEYTDGTYHLTEYWEPGEATFEADVRSRFPDESAEQALNYATSLSALKNHCTYQTILYFGQDCTNLIESLIGEICSSLLYMSSIAPYIETHPEEYALLEYSA